MKQHYNNAHPNGTTDLYSDLIIEEFKEWGQEEEETEEDFKELLDLLWVVLMYSIEKGYDLPNGFKELNKEFMSKFLNAKGKFKPMYRTDGKLLKGEGFKKADLSGVFMNKTLK